MPTCMYKPLPPFIVFNGAPAGGSSNPPAEMTDDEFLEQNGFPRNTAEKDMTPEQGRAYWRNMSKAKQKEAESKDRELSRWTALGDFDTVSQSLSDADEERRKALTEAQRATEDATKAADAARAAGFAEAREKFAKPAITSILLARTKRADESDEEATERITGVIDALNVSAFLTTDGELDAAKVETFAQSLGTGAANGSSASSGRLAQTLGSTSTTPVGSGGSVQALREQVKERLSK